MVILYIVTKKTMTSSFTNLSSDKLRRLMKENHIANRSKFTTNVDMIRALQDNYRKAPKYYSGPCHREKTLNKYTGKCVDPLYLKRKSACIGKKKKCSGCTGSRDTCNPYTGKCNSSKNTDRFIKDCRKYQGVPILPSKSSAIVKSAKVKKSDTKKPILDFLRYFVKGNAPSKACSGDVAKTLAYLGIVSKANPEIKFIQKLSPLLLSSNYWNLPLDTYTLFIRKGSALMYTTKLFLSEYPPRDPETFKLDNVPIGLNEHIYSKKYMQRLYDSIKGLDGRVGVLYYSIMYKDGGHANALIFNSTLKTMYRFDPNGTTFSPEQELAIENHLKQQFTRPLKYKFITSSLLACPRFPQAYTRDEFRKVCKSGGYCVVFTALLLHLVMLYPKMTIEDIINGLQNTTPAKLFKLVRKYYTKISQ